VKQFLATTVLTVPFLIGAQQQSAGPRAGWPCGARLDPSYFQVAEGTGGHLLLLSPEEIGDSAALLDEFARHAQTIFRRAGSLTPGSQEFRVPIDPSVESVLFSVSVQCLQAVDVVRPSGLAANGDDVTHLSNFRAERMVIVKRPEPGVWTVAVSGSGVSAVVVQARSGFGIADVKFAAAGAPNFIPLPSAGIENTVRIRLSDRAADVHASLVSGAFRAMGQLPLEAGDTGGVYQSRFTPGEEGFRILVVGKDGDGNAFQRMFAPLIWATR
jgi:hypothetical protein